MGLFDRLRDGLSRTTQHIVSRFDALVQRADASTSPDVSPDIATLAELEEILLSADVGVAATEKILASVKARTGRGTALRAIVTEELLAIFDAAESAAPSGPRPIVTLVVGVNGTGKTTTVGKLAKVFVTAGERTLVCAADTFRAAAVEQLEVWARRAGVDIICARDGADPAAVVFDAIQAGKAQGCDRVLVDTAGRLHNRVNLMNELEKIRRVAARAADGAPHEVLLVMDATVGQNGVQQAREFMAVAGVTAIVLTKLDGTAKGGVAVAIANDLRLPIRYVGIGEGIDDLIPFRARDYVNALFERPW